jgi:Na+-translocating ferredoxin:NAD+ oxidoreductase RnfG subunit
VNISAPFHMVTATIAVLGLTFVFGVVGPSSAKVFASQNQALAEAFPEATRIVRDTRVLKADEVTRIEAMTRNEVESKIVVLHTAYLDDEVLGHAHIDVHTVRTQPEAFMVVVAPSGVVRSVRVLAFHEPLDYLPTNRWYAQFEGKGREDALRVGHDVHGVVGATLSARAAADGVRRMLAYWEVLLKADSVATIDEKPAAAEGAAQTP